MVITTSGTIATFKTPSPKPIQSLKVYFGPIQEGSGDPSPTNVRNINGRTGIEVIHCGKNLFDPGWYINKTETKNGLTFTMQSDGSIVADGDTPSDKEVSKVYNIMRNNIPPGNYYASVGPYTTTKNGIEHATHYVWDSTAGARAKKWDGTTNMGFYSTGRKCAEIQLIEGHSYGFGIRYFKNTTVEDEVSYPAIFANKENPDNTTYEPYNGNIITIDWTEEAGEVAGGYIDLISGELVITQKIYRPTEYYWLSSSETHACCAFAMPGGKKVWSRNLVSNLAKVGSASESTIGQPTTLNYWYEGSDYAYNLVYASFDDFPTHADLAAYLLANNYEFTGELAEPIIYQLTPQQLLTLVGRNNIWGIDCNNVEVSYDFEELLDMTRTRQKILKSCQIYKTKLPPGFVEYDWCETTANNSRFNTQVSGDDETLKIDTAFRWTGITNNYLGVFGNYKTESDNYCWRAILPNLSTYPDPWFMYVTMGNRPPASSHAIYSAGSNADKISILNKKITLHMEYGTTTTECDGRLYTVNATKTDKQINTNNIAIGASSVGASGGNASTHCRIYRFKMWSQGKLIRDYHPCIRLRDNKAGFYDMINYTFNPSIGSVDFIAGNDIGGLYVYLDNSVYSAGDFVTADQNITSNNDFFITGFYDTGSTDAKSYTVTNNPLYPYGNDQNQYSVMLFYNDKTGTAVDYKYIGQTYATRTFTVTGRYIIASVYKPNAANFYIYDNTNQRYIIKGSNVT